MGYDQIYDELKKLGVYQFGSYISASQYRRVYDYVGKYAQNHETALDWGAGEGHFSFFLLNQGFTVTSFSIQDDCFLGDYLRTKYPGKYNHVFEPKAIKRLPFDDCSFDVVSSIGVLEHVRESGGKEIDSLKEIYRVLKPNGIFICYHFPNKYSWNEFLTKRMPNKHNHTYKYSKRDTKNLIESVGFHLLDYRRYGFFPRLMFSNSSNNFTLTKLFNIADSVGSVLLSPICQNHCFVLKK